MHSILSNFNIGVARVNNVRGPSFAILYLDHCRQCICVYIYPKPLSEIRCTMSSQPWYWMFPRYQHKVGQRSEDNIFLCWISYFFTQRAGILFSSGEYAKIASSSVPRSINEGIISPLSFLTTSPWKYWQMLCICCCIIQIMYWQQWADGFNPSAYLTQACRYCDCKKRSMKLLQLLYFRWS